MSWTQPSDVEDRWIGNNIPANETQLTTLIGDAEDTILREFPNLQDRIDNDEVPVSRVIKVASRMVIRHLRNPDGTRSTSRGSGPFQESVTFGGNEPGALYLTDEDRQELQSTSQGHSAFTIDTTPPGAYVYPLEESVWWPIA